MIICNYIFSYHYILKYDYMKLYQYVNANHYMNICSMKKDCWISTQTHFYQYDGVIALDQDMPTYTVSTRYGPCSRLRHNKLFDGLGELHAANEHKLLHLLRQAAWWCWPNLRWLQCRRRCRFAEHLYICPVSKQETTKIDGQHVWSFSFPKQLHQLTGS